MKYFFKRFYFVFLFFLLIILFLSAFSEEKPDRIEEEISFREGELIVKFTPSTALALRKEQSQTGLSLEIRNIRSVITKELYDLFTAANVMEIRPFFPSIHRELQLNNQDADRVFMNKKARFKKRSRRSPREMKRPSIEDIFLLIIDKGTDLEKTAEEFSKSSYVEYASPNYIVVSTAAPNDPYYNSSGSWGQSYDDLWGIKKLECEYVWDNFSATGEGVIVAVIDSGVDYNHEDLAGNIWVNPGEDLNGNGIADPEDYNGIDDDHNDCTDDILGWDHYYEDEDVMDNHGHGTHCAGTIAAIGNNNTGVIGVAPSAKIMIANGSNDSGTGHAYSSANAIRYAVDQGADILNCSISLPGSAMIDALQYAYWQGVVSVVAAGNYNLDTYYDNYYQREALEHIILVAGSDPYDQKWSASNYGYHIDIAAPSEGILSTIPDDSFLAIQYPQLMVGDNYFVMKGTSMACPHVAGLAALLVGHYDPGQFEGAFPDVIRGIIRASAAPFSEEPLFPMGTGIANAKAAFLLEMRPYVRIRDYQISETFGEGGDWDQIPESNEKMDIKLTLENIGPVPIDSGLIGYDITGEYIQSGSGAIEFGPIDLDESIEINEPLSFVVGNLPQSWPRDDKDALSMIRVRSKYNTITNINGFSFSVPLGIKRITKWPVESMFDVDNDYVVWIDKRGRKKQVYTYSISSQIESQLTDSQSNKTKPRIFGEYIAYMDDIDEQWDIFRCDLSQHTERLTNTVCLESCMSIYDKKTVWIDYRGNSTDVYLDDRDSPGEVRITDTEYENEFYTTIYDNRVVYMSENYSFYAYDLITGIATYIPIPTGQKAYPYIFKDFLFWSDKRNGNLDIYWRDMESGYEEQITSHPSSQERPHFKGNVIVWQDNRNGNWDIYLSNTAVGPRPLCQLTSQSTNQMYPRIYDKPGSGVLIFWYEESEEAIYMTEVSPTAH